jgi:glutaconate CoA-transferase subunit B
MRGGEFVEKRDYLTSPGYLEGGDSRKNTGLFPEGSGPSMLLTTKGVFHFDEKTREMVLVQVHPGITLDMIKKDIPWDLKVADNITVTPQPSDEEIDFIRRFAPTESVGRKLVYELGILNAFRKAGERSAKIS